jgi:CheY-like chemotaxis protein
VSRPTALIRVLIVEDNAKRIQTFLEWLPTDIATCIATSAGKAIRILQRDAKELAGILLDHDLHEQSVNVADLTLSGSDVSVHIARLVPRHVPVLIHSMNPSGSGDMARRLASAGFSVTRIPMADLTVEQMCQWLEEVRDNRDPAMEG